MTTRLIAAILILAAAACAPYKKIDTGRIQVGDLSLQTGQSWSQIGESYLPQQGPTAVWTADGLPLNQILIYAALDDGNPMFVAKGDERPFAVYRADMSASDIQELVEDSISRFYSTGPITTQYVRPHTFAGAEGVQFEFSFATKSNDLEYRTLATAAIMNGRLHLIIFTAPRLHYFDHLKPEVDGIISTAQTI
ncbi:MAG: hypothetical protein GDA49_12005 [Rhodospirillales bacterium]|nr:hypothetical protein [Rhodospirillales bacterium]